jgi:hypothetical protein
VVEKLKVTIILAWFLYPDSQNVVYQKEIDNIEAAYMIVEVRNANEITTRKVFINNIR